MKKKKRRRTPGEPAPRAPQWLDGAAYPCPWCSETVDTFPDPGGGEHQSYVEDCALCCRPNVIAATWDEAEGAWSLSASRE